jgi:o-succinylbenzoate synthase
MDGMMAETQRIEGIEWRGFRVPFNRPFATSQGVAGDRYGLLLFVTMSDGATGVGEASPVGAGSHTEVEAIAALLAATAPSLVGLTVDEAFRESAASRADGVLAFGLETALYDLLGKAKGLSLAALLGGNPRPVTVNATIAVDDIAEAVRQASEAVAQGFTCLKVKVGGTTPQGDEALLDAVRAAVGPNVTLRADANGAWSADQAMERLSRLERFNLEYVEQPVAPGDVAGLATVRRAVSVPIAADEAVVDVDSARKLLDANAADVLVVKPAAVGGLQSGSAIMRLAIERGCRSVVTSSLESGVGVAAALHLAACGSADMPACGLATASLLERDLLTAPLVPVNGALAIPSGPGLGVEVDMAALERYSIGIKGSTTA